MHELFWVQVCLQDVLFPNHPPLPQKSSGTLLGEINYIHDPNLAPMPYLALSQHSITDRLNSHYLLPYHIIDCDRRISMLVIRDVFFLDKAFVEQQNKPGDIF